MLIKGINKDKLFFTSDTHFQHRAIIDYCNRPFVDEYEMNEKLIENWNNVVPKDGIVFHAGDFAMTSNIEWITRLVNHLNGKIYLCLGNHDYVNRFQREVISKLFANIDDIFYLTVQDEEVERGHVNFLICHYPMLFWRRGYFMLHGHVHSGPKSSASEKVPYHAMRYDIGIDNNNYYPLSYYDLKVIFNENIMNLKNI